MIQENIFLLYLVTASIVLIIVYFYFDLKKIKEKHKIHFDLLYNQITKEKILKEHYNNELLKVKILGKNTNQKLLTIKTSIVTFDESLKGIFK
ncbi:MAG: hypothetical protein HWD85_09795 [Flavobacteriaceae bacterium]|nr:hypothetical protein [Flavobacteriaceae bacterium]